MLFKIPKNSDKYQWTKHSVSKMKQYNLTEQRIKRVIRSPQRIEKGIAKNTIAVMQPTSMRRNKNGKPAWSNEIWVMYQLKKKKYKKIANYKIGNHLIKIISTWRYPGVSPANNPIPKDILNEVENIL